MRMTGGALRVSEGVTEEELLEWGTGCVAEENFREKEPLRKSVVKGLAEGLQTTSFKKSCSLI